MHTYTRNKLAKGTSGGRRRAGSFGPLRAVDVLKLGGLVRARCHSSACEAAVDTQKQRQRRHGCEAQKQNGRGIRSELACEESCK